MRHRARTIVFRPTLLVRFHGPLGFAALVAAVAHLAMLLVDDPDRLSLLNPYDAPGRARAALAALLALAALCAASMRRRPGRQTSRWRGLHVGLAAGALALAVGHAVGVREYLGVNALTATLLALALVLGFLWHFRIPHLKPKPHSRHG